MDFDNDFSSTSLGIVGTEVSENIAEGASSLFSDPKEVKPIKEKEKEEVKPTEESFDSEPLGSALLDEEPEEEPEVTPTFEEEEPEPEDEAPIEEVPQNQYNQLAQDLYDAGVFQLDDGEEPEEISTPEQLLEKFQDLGKKEANKQINGFFNQAGQEAYDAVKAIIIDKVDPEVYFKAQLKIESIQNLDIEDESNQELIVKQYYKNLGWSEDRVQKKVEKLKDYGDLSDEAQVAQEKLAETEKIQLEREQATKQHELAQREQQKIAYAQNIGSLMEEGIKSKEFQGIPLNVDIARATLDYMTAPKWTLPKTGENITDFDKLLLDLKLPENYDKALKIALLEQSGWDFSKIKSKAITKETNKLFQRAMQKEKVDKRKNPIQDNFII